MRIIRYASVYFCAGAAALAQEFTPISNLNQPTGGYNSGVEGNQVAGIAFNTGADTTILTSFSISLNTALLGDFFNPIGPLNLYLYADAGGLPGSNLTAMVSNTGNNFPTNAGVYAYTPATPQVLQANKRYWIVADSTLSAGGSGYKWNITLLTNLDAGSIWIEGTSAYNIGSGWFVQPGYYFLFSVSVLSTNLPPLAISRPIVLTYTNVNYPYVLQQNSDLASTNWVTVTNATLSGVLGSQVVFILPPSAPQLFYRLSGR